MLDLTLRDDRQHPECGGTGRVDLGDGTFGRCHCQPIEAETDHQYAIRKARAENETADAMLAARNLTYWDAHSFIDDIQSERADDGL